MEYTVVFDVTAAGYGHWWFPAFGLLSVIIGILVVLNRRRLPDGWLGCTVLLLTLSSLFTTLSFLVTYTDYQHLASDLRDGRCAMVEGVVTDFDPMPAAGHKYESFTVAGKRFAYSDYVSTAGFNNTSSHGGPIREGQHVRIRYLGNEIARLEILR